MEVAAHVFDGTAPPPILRTAQNYKAWGVADIMLLPAGTLPRMNTALNYFNALSGYKHAGKNSVGWASQNPSAWNMVSWVIAERKRGRDGNID